MSKNLIDVIKAVLTNPLVIFATVVVVLYLNFVMYVIRYRKKPPKVRAKKVVTPAPKPEASKEDDEE